MKLRLFTDDIIIICALTICAVHPLITEWQWENATSLKALWWLPSSLVLPIVTYGEENWAGPKGGIVLGLVCIPWLESLLPQQESYSIGTWQYIGAISTSIIVSGILIVERFVPRDPTQRRTKSRTPCSWTISSVLQVVGALIVIMLQLPLLGGRHPLRDWSVLINSLFGGTSVASLLLVPPFAFNLILYVILFVTQYLFASSKRMAASFTQSELIIAAQLTSRAIVSQTQILMQWNEDRIMGVEIPVLLAGHYDHVLAYGTVGLVLVIATHALLFRPPMQNDVTDAKPTNAERALAEKNQKGGFLSLYGNSLVVSSFGAMISCALVFMLYRYAIAVVAIVTAIIGILRWTRAATLLTPLMILLFGTTTAYLLASFLSYTSVLAVVFFEIVSREWSVLAYWATIIAGFAAVFASLSVATSAMKSAALNTIIRKLFHAMALTMFIPVLFWKPHLLRFCFGAAILIFIAFEYVRFSGSPYLTSIRKRSSVLGTDFTAIFFQLHGYLSMGISAAISYVTNDRDTSGPLTLSHIYLLVGCAMPLLLLHPWPWSAHPISIVIYSSGLVILGVADSMASIIGSRCGRIKWTSTKKSVEGTIAAVVSSFLSHQALIMYYSYHFVGRAHQAQGYGAQSNAPSTLSFGIGGGVFLATLATCLLEAFTEHLDNLVLPPFFMSCLLAVAHLS